VWRSVKCIGSQRKPCQIGFIMVGEFEKQEGLQHHFSVLLELSAFDDLIGFKSGVEEEGHDVDEESFWSWQLSQGCVVAYYSLCTSNSFYSYCSFAL
jgi:hypothetical protein